MLTEDFSEVKTAGKYSWKKCSWWLICILIPAVLTGVELMAHLEIQCCLDDSSSDGDITSKRFLFHKRSLRSGSLDLFSRIHPCHINLCKGLACFQYFTCHVTMIWSKLLWYETKILKQKSFHVKCLFSFCKAINIFWFHLWIYDFIWTFLNLLLWI